MLDRRTIDRLRSIDANGNLILSVYVGIGPDLDELRSVSARLKSMIRPLRDLVDSGSLDPAAARGLQADLDTAVGAADRLGADLGRGTAMFLCSAAGLDERISLPAPVRDRAIVERQPYLGPLEAMLGHFHRYCAVVVDRRIASIYRFDMDELEAWEEISEEEVRKHNYGGFGGYDERNARGHVEAVARRLFRAAADRVAMLFRSGEFDLLAIGGSQPNIDAFAAEIPSDLRDRLAGTFVIDPGTATPADVLDRCRELAAVHERETGEREVRALLEAAGAGGRAVLGLPRVVTAANQRAIDRLLVNATDTVSGRVCGDCGWLMERGSLCPACGEATRPIADLIDAAAERARADGGSVRYVFGETDMGDAQVGALVRFPVADIR